MDQRQKNRLMLLATVTMLAATVLLMTRNELALFQNNTQLTVKRDRDDPDTIVFYWRNQVDAPMAAKFDAAWREWRNEGERIVIDLHSPGGAIAEGEEVIKVIDKMKRTHIVDTRVRNRRSCFSMCVPIFLQGETRYAGERALFMFHEPTSVDLYTGEKVNIPQFEQEMTTRRYFARYFVNSEMNPQWRDALAEKWKGKDLFYTARELVDEGSNIVTVLE